MKEQVIIKVERTTDNPLKPKITLFERVIDNDTSLVVPYQVIIDAFRFIYPNSIISVSSSSY